MDSRTPNHNPPIAWLLGRVFGVVVGGGDVGDGDYHHSSPASRFCPTHPHLQHSAAAASAALLQ